MSDIDLLKYSDEVDKSLGVAGMAIALLACEGENYIAYVSVEDGDETITFAPEAFFSGNPRFSAKIAWLQTMKDYQIFSGIIFGNILCRNIAAKREMPGNMLDVMRQLIADHGIKDCALDEDEVVELFDKDLLYFRRLFNHPAVADVARDLATTLRMQRRMTAGEVFENLRRLSAI